MHVMQRHAYYAAADKVAALSRTQHVVQLLDHLFTIREDRVDQPIDLRTADIQG
jgi:hypothetical protein